MPPKTYKFKKNKVDVEVGNPNSDKFEPQAKLFKNGRYLAVEPKLVVKNAKVISTPNRLIYRGDDAEFHFHTLDPTEQYEEGGFELDIRYKTRPETNVISLNVEAPELGFHRQEALQQFVVGENIEIPENVIGSYAIYCDKRDNEDKTGKLFHIYRPWIVDANGRRVWSELNISNNLMTITHPQDFLDNAKYPIRHVAGATIGYTTAGGSSVFSKNFIYSNLSSENSLSESGDFSKITVCGKQGGGNIKCAIYDNDGILVTNGTTVEKEYGISKGWVDFEFSTAPSLAAGDYYVAVWHGSSTWNYLYYDALSDYKYKSSTYDGWPDPIFWYGAVNRKFSIYATYTATGGGTAVPVMMRHYRNLREA